MGCLLKGGGGLYPRLRIGAVLLAAGEGRRMGGAPKALIRLQGVPLIRRQLVALSGAGVDEVVVVTGHAHDAVEDQVRSFPVTLIHHADFALGEDSSTRLGLASLNGPFDAVFVLPCDLPLIAADDLTELIGAFKKRPAGHVIIPVVNGEPGNPVLLDDEARGSILASRAHRGCRQLLAEQPGLVHGHATANRRFVTELNTPDDVRALAERTGWRLDLPEAAVA
jgi:molybdenum cofactor cytidylyltransferase